MFYFKKYLQYKMSDSSEEEDLSKFQESVDTSFTKLINETRGVTQKVEERPPSERYLQTSSHYNDVKVPEKMQSQISAKISKIIEKNVVFVDVQNGVKKRKVKGGVKLFSSSTDFLSPEAVEDTYTAAHNIQSKKSKKRRRQVDAEEPINEDDRVKSVTVSGDYVLSKEETKCWKSRRKEKLFRYKSEKNSKILTAVE